MPFRTMLYTAALSAIAASAPHALAAENAPAPAKTSGAVDPEASPELQNVQRKAEIARIEKEGTE